MKRHPARDAGSQLTVGTEGAEAVGDTHFRSVPGQRHAGGSLHRAVAVASQHLFSRAHSGRYFGGFWFKLFCERGPC
ncbi:MAG: hypothetical protein WCN81_13445 [Actinomycetes bacterium]